MIQELLYYSRMTVGIREYLRSPLGPDPVAALRLQIERRQERFLDLARRIVFSNPRHPYCEMFRLAGCTWQDLADEVTRQGLEASLEKLLAAGVYLTHDEFKGKVPLVRSGREIAATHASFLNPLVSGLIEARSGGSRSPGTPARQSTALAVYRTAYSCLEARELGLERRQRGLVYPVLPSSIGISTSLRLSRLNQSPARWFAPQGKLRNSGHYRVMTQALVRFGRALGAPLPLPESLPFNDFMPVARWLAAEKQSGKACAIQCVVSAALRVAAAARQAGLDISGTLFTVGGEALTDAKRAGIEAAGCQVFPRYIINEVGHVGYSCRQMRTGNRVHVFLDAMAVIGRRRVAPLADVTVDSLLFTTLLPFATRFLINAEMDDAGVLEPAACQCEYSALGMNLAVRDIFSYGKLTGQGVTLMGSDALRVLEVALPARFGGNAGDYQLVEVDGARQTELVLRVSPRVGARSTAAIRDCFLAEIQHCYGGSLAARLWRHTAGLQVVIEEPDATLGGKVLTLHTTCSAHGNHHAT